MYYGSVMNVPRMVIIIWTCYNWYYNSISIERQQVSFKHFFSWTGVQTIGLETIET